MDFLHSGLWWTLFGFCAAITLVYSIILGSLNSDSKYLPRFRTINGVGILVIIALAFIFTGWKGGLAIVISAFLLQIIWGVLKMFLPRKIQY